MVVRIPVQYCKHLLSLVVVVVVVLVLVVVCFLAVRFHDSIENGLTRADRRRVRKRGQEGLGVTR